MQHEQYMRVYSVDAKRISGYSRDAARSASEGADVYIDVVAVNEPSTRPHSEIQDPGNIAILAVAGDVCFYSDTIARHQCTHLA